MEYCTIEELYAVYLRHPLIVKDTRDIQESCIFIAIKGDNFDANNFAKQAIKDGAAYVLIDNPEKKEGNRFLLVENTLIALQELAKHHRSQLNIPIIGITGSNGKTTSKELIKSTLSQKYNTYATKGNYNNHIGVPLSVLEINKNHEIAIIEMGASAQHEIDFLCQISKPNFGLITNIGKAHLEGFGGIEGVKKGKAELYRHIEEKNGILFLNKDDKTLVSLIKSDQIIQYSINTDSECQGEITQTHPNLKGSFKTKNHSGKIDSPLYGEYNFYNMLAAACIGNYFNLSTQQIEVGINSYRSANNRSQLILFKGASIYLDAYNANPSSMESSVNNFSMNKGAKKVVILGDMFEVGNDSSIEHKKLIDFTIMKDFSEQVFVGSLFFEHRLKFPNRLFFKTTEEAKEWFVIQEIKETEILIKGSRGMKLESLIQ
jgi:UDP-N-acetylmuramoyl-tripeptide--D-alanyl-D-alanine ligase